MLVAGNAENKTEWAKRTGTVRPSGDVVFFSSVASGERDKNRSFSTDRSADDKYFPLPKEEAASTKIKK
jgi:hypothetical protein